MDHLYKEEQKLLKQLDDNDNKERQYAIKRTIERINEDMKELEKRA